MALIRWTIKPVTPATAGTLATAICDYRDNVYPGSTDIGAVTVGPKGDRVYMRMKMKMADMKLMQAYIASGNSRADLQWLGDFWMWKGFAKYNIGGRFTRSMCVAS